MCQAPICPYCERKSVYADSAEVYNGKSYGMIYLCRPCDAYVGTHKNSKKPLGRLADAELRKWKRKAHNAFDPLWEFKTKRMAKHIARNNAYRWLAVQLKIDRDACHIGKFDIDMCKKVIAICDRKFSDRVASDFEEVV